jgi:dipeptidyl aminopeptidase/acylaminoacyl peptidase
MEYQALARMLRGLLFALAVLAWPSARLTAAPPLETFGKLPGFERAAISASGDHVALIGSVGDQRRLLVFDKNKSPIFSASLGDAKIRGLRWAGDEIVLVDKSVTEKLEVDFLTRQTELAATIVVNLATGKSWAVFDNKSMITGGVRGSYGVIQRDGKWYGYFGGITYERGNRGVDDGYLVSTAPNLYEVDLQTGNAHLLADRTDGEYRQWLIGPNGAVSAIFDINASGNWSIRNSAGARIAAGANLKGDVGLIGFGATPGTIIYADQPENDSSEHWFELPLTGGEPNEILQNVMVRSTIVDNRKRSLAGYEVDGDIPTYHLFDARQQKIVAATQKAFPGLSMQLIDWNDAFDRLIVMTEGPGDPQTWWLVDIKTGKADQLGVSYPMRGSDVGPMKMIHYKAGDGTDIAAVLTLPPGRPASNLPVVLLPHGGPTARDYPGFDWWAQAFASRGYAVLQPNFRGSSGYGVAFERAGYGEWGRKMQTDISDGLTYLAQQGIADPKRACIMGASYGGYAALAGVTVQQGIYRCAVAVAGLSDIAKFASDRVINSGFNKMYRRVLRSELGSGRDLAAVSPVHFAGSVTVPILLIHGKDDTVVPFDQSNDMAVALRAAGKPVQFVTLKAEDHWLSNSDTRLQMLQAAVAFVEKHNPPDPAK